MQRQIISVDWGSSSLRLYLVSLEPLKIVATHQSQAGILQSYTAWQAAGQPRRKAFYEAQLKQEIERFSQHLRQDLSRLPRLISGMASSSLGWVELPYAELPFEASGAQMKYQALPETKDQAASWVFSGLVDKNDVMRGEESQWLGLMHSHPGSEKCWIFPGTHSKHMQVVDRQVVGFSTFFTGELFQLLARHSSLRVSLNPLPWSDAYIEAFASGVQQARQGNLLHDLFQIRARDLLHQADTSAAYFRLSGRLIGEELTGLSAAGGIVLAANAALYPLYLLAFEVLKLKGQCRAIPPEAVSAAIPQAHAHLYQRLQAMN